MKKKLFLLSFLGMLILSSCLKAFLKQEPVPSPTEHLMLKSTLEALSTPVNIFEYPGQVSDGKLLFSIEESEDTCHNISDPIEIKLIFHNLTDQSINFIKEFSISSSRQGAGNLTPFLTTDKGDDVYSYTDVSMFDTVGNPVDDYVEISAKEIFVSIAEYRFPQMLVESITSDPVNYLTPRPGKYFLRIVYLQYERDIETWYGSISSNQIEICVTN